MLLPRLSGPDGEKVTAPPKAAVVEASGALVTPTSVLPLLHRRLCSCNVCSNTYIIRRQSHNSALKGSKRQNVVPHFVAETTWSFITPSAVSATHTRLPVHCTHAQLCLCTRSVSETVENNNTFQMGKLQHIEVAFRAGYKRYGGIAICAASAAPLAKHHWCCVAAPSVAAGCH